MSRQTRVSCGEAVNTKQRAVPAGAGSAGTSTDARALPCRSRGGRRAPWRVTERAPPNKNVHVPHGGCNVPPVVGVVEFLRRSCKSRDHFRRRGTHTGPRLVPGTAAARTRAYESEMVTLMPRFPLSANSWAMLVSKTRQSLLMMAAWTPSWMLRGVASQVRRRLRPFSSRR